MPKFSRAKLSASQQKGYDRLDRAGKAAFRSNYNTASPQGAARMRPSAFKTSDRSKAYKGGGAGSSEVGG